MKNPETMFFNKIFNKIFKFIEKNQNTNIHNIRYVPTELTSYEIGISGFNAHFLTLEIDFEEKEYLILIESRNDDYSSIKINIIQETNKKEINLDFKYIFNFKNLETDKILSIIESTYFKLSQIPISIIKKHTQYKKYEILSISNDFFLDHTKKELLNLILNIGIENKLLDSNEIFTLKQTLLNYEWIIIEKSVQKKINDNFDSLYFFLQSKQFNFETPFIFNNFKNKSYYLKHENVRGIHLRSQENSYFIAKNKKHIKIWISPFLSTEWKKEILYKFDKFSDTLNIESFNILEEFKSYFAYDHYYVIPIIMNKDDYPKTAEQLLLNFDNEQYLLYDSKKGLNNDFSYINFRIFIEELEIAIHKTLYN